MSTSAKGLSGKQRRFLRSRGQLLKPAAVIGRNGLSEQAIENVRRLLADHELIKVKLPQGDVRKQMADDLAEAVEADCVGVVGRTALLYRPKEDMPCESRIALPA